MGVNSLPKTVTRQRRDCDLNPGPSAPESSTLTTRLPSRSYLGYRHAGCLQLSQSRTPDMCGLLDPPTDGRRSAAIFGFGD